MKKILVLTVAFGSFSLLAQVRGNDTPGSESCSGIISAQMNELMMENEELNKITLESLKSPSAARTLGEVMGAFRASQSAVSKFCQYLEALKK